MGAIYAPYLATNLGFVGGANADAVETAIAILAGFLAQLVGWLIFASLGLITIAIDERLDYGWLNDSGLIGNVFASVTAIAGIVVIIAASLAPLVGLYFLFTCYPSSVMLGVRPGKIGGRVSGPYLTSEGCRYRLERS